MNVLKRERKLAVISALLEGNSLRSVSRMTNVHRTAIQDLLVAVGDRCASLLDEQMRGLTCSAIEADEIWCYVSKKQRHLTPDERLNPELGDQWTFVAMDPMTKLVPVSVVGKRDTATTTRFIGELKSRITSRFQLSTDGFKPYVDAVASVFGNTIDYAQIIKTYATENPGPGRYSPPSVTGIEKNEIFGAPERGRICTSYVERNNLTIRMQLRRFTRLTNAFSRKLANLKAPLALHFAHFNLCRIHGSLRVTPAMAAGITDRLWDLDELLP